MRRVLRELLSFDGVFAILAAAFSVAFVLKVGPAFAKMFSDFHRELSAFTELGLTRWFPLAVGVVPLLSFAARVRFARSKRAVQVASVATELLSAAGPVLLLVAMYSSVPLAAGDGGLDLPSNRDGSGYHELPRTGSRG